MDLHGACKSREFGLKDILQSWRWVQQTYPANKAASKEQKSEAWKSTPSWSLQLKLDLEDAKIWFCVF